MPAKSTRGGSAVAPSTPCADLCPPPRRGEKPPPFPLLPRPLRDTPGRAAAPAGGGAKNTPPFPRPPGAARARPRRVPPPRPPPREQAEKAERRAPHPKPEGRKVMGANLAAKTRHPTIPSFYNYNRPE